MPGRPTGAAGAVRSGSPVPMFGGSARVRMIGGVAFRRSGRRAFPRSGLRWFPRSGAARFAGRGGSCSHVRGGRRVRRPACRCLSPCRRRDCEGTPSDACGGDGGACAGRLCRADRMSSAPCAPVGLTNLLAADHDPTVWQKHSVLVAYDPCVETPEKTPRKAKVVPYAAVLCRPPLALSPGRIALRPAAELRRGRRSPRSCRALSAAKTYRRTQVVSADAGKSAPISAASCERQRSRRITGHA